MMIRDYKHYLTLFNIDTLFYGIKIYPYGTPAVAFKVCESEMMVVGDFFVEKYADCPFYGNTILQQT